MDSTSSYRKAYRSGNVECAVEFNSVVQAYKARTVSIPLFVSSSLHPPTLNFDHFNGLGAGLP